MRGKFITFEGTEGVGKTTQIDALAEHIRSQGHQVLVTKEPGGTDFGMHIRKIILDKDTVFHSRYTEVLLFIADRLEHVKCVIEPALEQGTWVLCDRYIDSTIAYQIGGRGLPRNLIDMLQGLVELVPDKTILLDLPVEEGLRRAVNRATLDRFEQETIDFHHRLRETYLSLAAENPERIVKIDCDGSSKEDIATAIKTFF